MRIIITIFCLSLILFTCSEEKESNENDSSQSNYDLVEVDSYEFRRSYQTQDSLEEGSNLFYIRNPELVYSNSGWDRNLYYSELVNQKIIQENSLNLSQVDTLPDHFEYQFSERIKFTVDLSPGYSEKLETAIYELTFKNSENIILVDTLEFLEFLPPNVTFFTADLNEDDKQELITIYNWYFMIGDNYELKVYELRNRSN